MIFCKKWNNANAQTAFFSSLTTPASFNKRFPMCCSIPVHFFPIPIARFLYIPVHTHTFSPCIQGTFKLFTLSYWQNHFCQVPSQKNPNCFAVGQSLQWLPLNLSVVGIISMNYKKWWLNIFNYAASAFLPLWNQKASQALLDSHWTDSHQPFRQDFSMELLQKN